MRNPLNFYWKKLFNCEGKVLGKQSLRDLMEGKHSVIVLKNYLSNDELDEIKARIKKLSSRLEVKKYSNGTLTTFGSYLAKHLNSLPKYFKKANETDLLFNKNNDFRKKIRDCLCETFQLEKLEVARKGVDSYSPAVVRLHSDGVSNPLHNDNIMRDAKSTNLILKKLKNQFSCIVCIQECDEGGELKNYSKRWDPQDEIFKIPGDALGYESKVLENALCDIFKPETGDIYIIDPTYYHEICKVIGKTRITLGFFFGFLGEDFQQGVVWS